MLCSLLLPALRCRENPSKLLISECFSAGSSLALPAFCKNHPAFSQIAGRDGFAADWILSHAVGLCRWEGRPLWRALRFTIGRAFTPTLQCYLGTVPCILDGFRLFIVQSTSAERSERARSSPPPAPMGLRGAWVVAARCCAGIVERSFGMSKGKRARSAKTRSTSKVRAKASLSEDESQSFIPSKSDSRGRLKCRLSPPPPWCSPATVWRLRNGNWLIPFRTKPIGDICVGVGLS